MLDFVLSLLGTILYPLFSIIFLLLDLVQSMFYMFAGIGAANYAGQDIGSGNTGLETDTGLIYYLLNSDLIKNLLMSISILALFLLVVFTVMAFIKNSYVAKPKGWKDIVFSAIKGLANFIFLPTMCLLGVWLGNILLNAINGATSTGGATIMSRKLFLAASYNANKLRVDHETDYELIMDEDNQYVKLIKNAGIDYDISNTSGYYWANKIDEAYGSGSYGFSWLGINKAPNIYQYTGAGVGYHLYHINYLVLIVGGVFMMYALGAVTFGMIKRMFMLMILFVISPALCAMYPIDDGAATKQWSGEFKKNVLSAYGAVAGMNLFFSILPIIDNINLMGIWGMGNGNIQTNSLAESILEIILLTAGLFVVKDVISLISGFVGGGNAYNEGTGLMSQTTKKIGSTATKTASVFARATASHAAGGSFWGSLAKQAGEGIGKFSGFDSKKIKEAAELGADPKKGDGAVEDPLTVGLKGIGKIGKGAVEFGKGVGRTTKTLFGPESSIIWGKKNGIRARKKDLEDNKKQIEESNDPEGARQRLIDAQAAFGGSDAGEFADKLDGHNWISRKIRRAGRKVRDDVRKGFNPPKYGDEFNDDDQNEMTQKYMTQFLTANNNKDREVAMRDYQRAFNKEMKQSNNDEKVYKTLKSNEELFKGMKDKRGSMDDLTAKMLKVSKVISDPNASEGDKEMARTRLANYQSSYEDLSGEIAKGFKFKPNIELDTADFAKELEKLGGITSKAVKNLEEMEKELDKATKLQKEENREKKEGKK